MPKNVGGGHRVGRKPAAELRSYVIYRPIRGEQTITVEATSAKDALERAANGEGEGLGFDITWHGQGVARLDLPKPSLGVRLARAFRSVEG